MTRHPTWRDAPAPFRTLAYWVTIAQAAGYGVSLAMVPRMPRSPDMLVGAHAHLLGMTALFAISGVLFAFCEKPGGAWKTRILAAPFIAILAAFTAVWFAKELDHRFVWLLPVTGLVMTVAFYTQTIRILRELRAAARADAAAGLAALRRTDERQLLKKK
jgi:hypothetical protein